MVESAQIYSSISSSGYLQRLHISKGNTTIDHNEIFNLQGRFGFDITPTQPSGPCCTTTTPRPTPVPGPFKCGAEGGTRIVGGVQSTVSHDSLYSLRVKLCFQAGKYPWIAAYQNVGQSVGGCAGTLVAAEWIVTAAHCIRRAPQSPDVTKENLNMVLGEYDISSTSDSADTNRFKYFYKYNLTIISTQEGCSLSY